MPFSGPSAYELYIIEKTLKESIIGIPFSNFFTEQLSAY
jgi:hypothetical protein